MLISRAARRPPTITMAKGRCESEPMPRETAAGNKPRVATKEVINIGRSRRTAPSIAAFPIDVISPRQLNLRAYHSNGLFDGAAKVAAADTVLNGHVALVPFAINF